MERGGSGTQSHLDYVRLGSVSVAHRLAGFVRRDLVDVCRLVECMYRFVCVEIGGVRIGGVYGKCGQRIYHMEQWLECVREVVGAGKRVLFED